MKAINPRFHIAAIIVLLLTITPDCEKYDDDKKIESVTFIEGNIYKTVTIGTQIWMAENLKTTTYRNGTEIPNATDNNEWANLLTSAYVWYDNNYDMNGNSHRTGQFAAIRGYSYWLFLLNTLPDLTGSGLCTTIMAL